VSILDWILRRQPDPTRDWPPNAGELPVVRTEPFSLGGLRLGDNVEAARPLGRPERTRRAKIAMALVYERWGLQLEFEENRLVEAIFVIGETWQSDIKGSPCRPRLADGLQLSPDTRIDRVIERFGEPARRRTDGDGETTLSYVRDGVYMGFEFDEMGRLESWNVGLD
jgi:hypothetical protein